MATDLETGEKHDEAANVRPGLKITGLHIRGLKSIGSLDLPGDGLGWDGPIPEMLMLGGINGSGKTTLLEFLVAAFEFLASGVTRVVRLPPALRASEAIIDFEVSIGSAGAEPLPIRFVIGNNSYLQANSPHDWLGYQPSETEPSIRMGGLNGHQFGEFHRFLSSVRASAGDPGPLKLRELPAIIYFPSEGRILTDPEIDYIVGDLPERSRFVECWAQPADKEDSLKARFYAVRWADMSAIIEENLPEEATQFRSYQLAFDRFFEGRKRLKWHRNKLVVETKSGDIHGLSDLSSGEKQVILFMGELLHRWRPGSLILIDEPELHLHESYQTKLWRSLVEWQKERGGQVIVATQSDHLFGISDPDIKVLLSVGRGR